MVRAWLDFSLVDPRDISYHSVRYIHLTGDPNVCRSFMRLI